MGATVAKSVTRSFCFPCGYDSTWGSAHLVLAPLAVLRTCPCIVMVHAEISAGVRRKHRRTFDIILKPRSGVMCFKWTCGETEPSSNTA